MTTSTTAQRRCDLNGCAFAGSQRQIQFYVNERPELLQQEISTSLDQQMALQWVSPLRVDKYREYRDDAFLEVLGLSRYREKLGQFWPKGGPVWDALALDKESGGILLVEAKSHVPEVFGNGCGAVAEDSILRIDKALAVAKVWLGAPEQADWKGRLYQSANRVAHLYFFRECLRLPAWLVNVYFTGDPHTPTPRTEWETAIAEVKSALGIMGSYAFSDVFLPALC